MSLLCSISCCVSLVSPTAQTAWQCLDNRASFLCYGRCRGHWYAGAPFFRRGDRFEVESVWDEPSWPERHEDDQGKEECEAVKAEEPAFLCLEVASWTFEEFNETVDVPDLDSYTTDEEKPGDV